MVCCCMPGRKRELFRSKVGDVSSGNKKVELCNDSDPALLRNPLCKDAWKQRKLTSKRRG